MNGRADGELIELVLKKINGNLIEQRSYKPGQIIFYEGEPCKGLLIVRQGEVKLYEVSTSGKEKTYGFLSAGQCCGLCSLFNGTNPLSAQSKTPLVLSFIPKNHLIDLIATDKEVYKAFLTSIYAHYRHLVESVDLVAVKGVKARIAKVLLGYADGNSSITPRLGLSQQELASYIGTTREVFCRQLHHLEQLNILKVGRRKIIIQDRAALEKIAKEK